MLSHCVDMFFKCFSSVKYVSPTLASLFKGNFTFPEKYLLCLILLFYRRKCKKTVSLDTCIHYFSLKAYLKI